MSPTTIMNNHSLLSDEEILENLKTSLQQFVTDLTLILLEIQVFLTDLLQYIAHRYAATFGSNHWLALLIFMMVLYIAETIVKTANYADRLKKLEIQNQRLEHQVEIQEGNIEFIFANHSSNELKLQKVTKQMKKLQKEVTEYM